MKYYQDIVVKITLDFLFAMKSLENIYHATVFIIILALDPISHYTLIFFPEFPSNLKAILALSLPYVNGR